MYDEYDEYNEYENGDKYDSEMEYWNEFLDNIPKYESVEECIAKTERDPFLKIIKKYSKLINDPNLKKKYQEFIEKYETPNKFNVPFFTPDVIDRIWCDKEGSLHSAYYCYSIFPYDAYLLDPKLLIVYAPYFIKKFGFPEWFNQFANDLDKKYLKFIQKNMDKLKLSKIEQKIVKEGNELSKEYWQDAYGYEDDEDGYWWYNDARYDIDENGHLVEIK